MTSNQQTFRKYFLLFILIFSFSYLQAEDRYIRDNAKEVVLDTSTKLMWQDNSMASSNAMNWQNGVNYCYSLNHGTYTDWVLPNTNELYSILDTNRASPAMDIIFQNTSNNDYLSSTTYSSNTDFIWVTNFNKGDNYYNRKTSDGNVRCVRIND